MPEVGIVMTLRDRVSNTMKAMISSGRALSKEFDDLYDRVVAAEDQQTSLEKEIAKTKAAITEQTAAVSNSKKAWREMRKEGTATEDQLTAQRKAYVENVEQLEKLKNQLNQYTAASKDAKAEIRDLSDEFKSLRKEAAKAEDDMPSEPTLGGGSSESSLFQKLSDAGLTKMAGDAVAQLGGAVIESALGQPTASAVSSIASGAATGFALGGAPGAAIGAIAGGISGVTQVFANQDDAFKSYYNGLYETVNAGTAEAITSGSSIAAGRETDAVSFATLFGGKEEAAAYLKTMVDMSNRTPFLYEDLKSMSKTMKTYGWDTREMIGDLTTIGDTGAALGMSTDDMNTVATALGRMQSSNKTTLEYLNLLTERGINAVGMLAEARGRTVAETYTDISKGDIAGTDAVQIILTAMEKTFPGSMEDQSQTFSGLTSTLEGLQEEISNAAGEGYNEQKAIGLNADIEAYGGLLGEALKNINTISGQNQAYLENLAGQYEREALSALLLGEETSGIFSEEEKADLAEMREAFLLASAEYADGNQEAGLKMESLTEEAKALATAAYDSSDLVQQTQDVQLEQIEAIRENTSALKGWQNENAIQQEQGKGLAAGIDWGNVWSTAQNAWETMGAAGATGGGAAYGLNYVPYDGFPARLHQGERVLTAGQARAQDAGAGTGQPFTIHIENATVREEADIDRIASAIVEKLEIARMAG